MGKFRSKLKGQTKGKRWPKGQSSSSNPDTRKHRDQAKSRFFQANLGSSNLTFEAVKRHEAIQSFSTSPSKDEIQTMEEDTISNASSYQTIQTFASEWTDCSNMSYSRFLKVFRSDSALHKEMLAILAAITEVIKENNGTETPAEYFCSLITTLEQILSAEDRNETQITAVCSLLNMGIKSVPSGVLKSTFNEVSLRLLQILKEYSESNNNVLIKSIFGVLTVFLRAQDLGTWSNSNTQHIFSAVLNPFSVHTKPKWRKTAQSSIAAILKADCFQDNEKFNCAADIVAGFVEQTLDACMGGNPNTVAIVSVQSGQTTILHVLGLLRQTVSCFSKSHIKKCCEIILRLLTLNYPIVSSCGLQVLHSLFSSQRAVMPAKLNGQLITALYDYQPSPNDVQPTLAWLAVMQQAHIHLADVDPAICCGVLPKIFTTITQLWLSEKMEVISAATYTLEAMLRDTIGPICATTDFVEQNKSKVVKCFSTIEAGLGYQYHNAWHQVLHIMSVLYDVAGRTCGDLLTNSLKSLCEIRDSYKFSYNNELEHAVGSAIRSMGPEKVLGVISLQKESGEFNIDRSWLLPVLRENVKQCTLNFWSTCIFPLAIYCQKRAAQLDETNDRIGAHSSELLYEQLWNLLPSFCNAPTDIKSSFKNIAKALGTAISDKKELRLAVMASLRKLISYAKETGDKDDLAEIARFDKNYLPILFNVYTSKPVRTDEEGQRLAALETIKIYLTITRPELTKQLFTSALEKLSTTEETDQFLIESVMDLIRALVQYQSLEEIQKLYEDFVKKLPEIKNTKEQKKLYRVLEEICGSESEGCKKFVQSNRKIVQKLLQKSLDTAAVSSKGARLRCFNYLIKAQPQLDHESTLIKSVIPEAVLCCKDINERCRATAYLLLNTIGETLQEHNQLQQFINLIVAGLGGTTELISSTILALASILHRFTGSLGKENIQLILENICLLMSSSTREIVASCFSFIKVYCSSLPNPMVAASVGDIMKALCSMTEDCKRHFRLKLRDILDKFVRKYGCETLTPHIPADDVIMYKRLRNLRKLNARKKRQNESNNNEDEEMDEDFLVKTKPRSLDEILADSDSDLDMEDDKPVRTKKGKKQPQAWIEEDLDNIVDFKDPSAASKITATKPGEQSQIDIKKKKDKGFKTTSDGRLIIEDDDDSSDDGIRKKSNNFDSDSDSDDTQSKAETMLLTDKKRKRKASGSVKSEFSSSGQPLSKYKAGGSGIHRPLGSVSGSVYSGVGSEYRSKKAQGDVKRKGKVDPYAYLPLQRNSLNKR
ncbi:putative nodulin-like protein [Holotrichia oblita]|uniref:Nodulin-like protein n=1 Tax=Holotrichia oblita TaxID=644536 RepID=A0ACB9T5E3_HOLOL|nr:putative nodulin-like protein [Holotrichia oblita]